MYHNFHSEYHIGRWLEKWIGYVLSIPVNIVLGGGRGAAMAH